jgi:uncharacterized protein YndB with AHSA1/START domain
MAAPTTLSTTFTTPSDRDLVAIRVFDAPKSRLWDMHTKCEHMQQWMLGPEGMSMPVCEIELRPGGAWHNEWRAPDGSMMEMNGEYKEILPGEKIVQTENWGGDFPETVNTTEFSEQNGKTTVTTTVRYPSKKDREAALATGMKEGWSESYDRLDNYLRKAR